MHHKPLSYCAPRKPHASLFRAAVIVLALGLGAPFAVKAAEVPAPGQPVAPQARHI